MDSHGVQQNAHEAHTAHATGLKKKHAHTPVRHIHMQRIPQKHSRGGKVRVTPPHPRQASNTSPNGQRHLKSNKLPKLPTHTMAKKAHAPTSSSMHSALIAARRDYCRPRTMRKIQPRLCRVGGAYHLSASTTTPQTHFSERNSLQRHPTRNGMPETQNVID